MLRAVEQTPRANRWAGEANSSVFGVAVRRLPTGDVRQRATPLLLNATQVLAIEELLLTKTIVQKYAEAGLTDVPALRQAAARSASGLHSSGRVTFVSCEARLHGEFVVAYVIAEAPRLSADLLQPEALESIRSAYRDALHRRMREQMAAGKWKDAVRLWEHLRGCKLLSPDVALDAARCFHELKAPKEVVSVLKEALTRFDSVLSADWLEQCGDLALEQGAAGQLLARGAYVKASKLLLNTRSAGKQRLDTPVGDP